MKPLSTNELIAIAHAMPPDARGIPSAIIADISQSVIEAWHRRLLEDRADPIHRWATVLEKDPPSPPTAIATDIVRAAMDPIKARQLTTARKGATPPHQNRWIRDWWIISNWITLQDDELDTNGPEIGLCDLTDELAAAVIGTRFTTAGFGVSAFRKFRKKYNLLQVPEAVRLAGKLKESRGETTVVIERFAPERSR